jgi:ankyrin repeat protein
MTKIMNLLNTGVDINTERNGKSLLHVASAEGCYAIVWLLLQRGVDYQKRTEPKVVDNLSVSNINQKGGTEGAREGRTAVDEVSIHGYIKVAALLAKVASDQGFQISIENALLLVAELGRLSMVEGLFRFLKTVSVDFLRASLYFAAKGGHIDVVRFLLLGGAETIRSMYLSLSSAGPHGLMDRSSALELA